MVYVMLADGFEEVEALVPIDLLRRAGLDVKTVGVTGMQVSGAHGVTVQADCDPVDVQLDGAELLFLPGGMPGTKNLYESQFVRDAVQNCVDNQRFVAAICAAPSIILGGMGLLQGRKATCFPGMEDGMTGAEPQNQAVVVDGKLITGQAAGAAFVFALTLCEQLLGKEKAAQVAQSIYYAE